MGYMGKIESLFTKEGDKTERKWTDACVRHKKHKLVQGPWQVWGWVSVVLRALTGLMYILQNGRITPSNGQVEETSL